MSTVLSVTNLDAGYHGHPIVRGFQVELEAGETCALLGPNGAGKTTTLLTLAGELPPIGGEIEFAGLRSRSALHLKARRGLSLVTEERSVFSGMSVLDNLRVARADIPYALGLFPELGPLLARKAGFLSSGEQHMLALARALARRPKLLLVDELSLGLAPLVVRRLLGAVSAAARDDGVAILLVEQHAHQAVKIADEVLVMRRGEVVLRGAARVLRDRLGELQSAYLAHDSGTPGRGLG